MASDEIDPKWRSAWAVINAVDTLAGRDGIRLNCFLTDAGIRAEVAFIKGNLISAVFPLNDSGQLPGIYQTLRNEYIRRQALYTSA